MENTRKNSCKYLFNREIHIKRLPIISKETQIIRVGDLLPVIDDNMITSHHCTASNTELATTTQMSMILKTIFEIVRLWATGIPVGVFTKTQTS